MQSSAGVLGVAIVGAGAVTQAIHLPTLARLDAAFRVVHLSDVDRNLAEEIARPLGARASASIDEVLADDGVDVVAICSPHHLHVAQVTAALDAGKAVLCEKPLALDRDGLASLSTAGTAATPPLMVGWMHLYDPVVVDALGRWRDHGERAHAIRVSAVLPSNTRFEDAATQVLRPERAPGQAGSMDDRTALRHGILTLAVHDLPLVRRLLPPTDGAPAVRVAHARWLRPWGYLVVLEVNGVLVELHAVFGQAWKPAWTLEAVSGRARLAVGFPPSYVHAGSAAATITVEGAKHAWAPAGEDGYYGEWLRLDRAVQSGERGPLDEALVDSAFAVALADAVDEAFTEAA